MAYDLRDYVDVAERLREFYERHPQGRIVTEVLENNDKRVTVRAEVFRKAEDGVPSGVGHSALAIPGVTQFTRGSELENAETSAVGRALVMAGLPSKRIASADEVEAKRTPTLAQDAAPAPASSPDDSVLAAATAIFGDDLAVPPVVKKAMEFAGAAGDGSCPKHKRPWTKKPGGVSKTTGKPYGSFWACDGKDDEGWCKAKPKISWIAAQESF